jgi:phospholipid transport system substrate-binding protein
MLWKNNQRTKEIVKIIKYCILIIGLASSAWGQPIQSEASGVIKKLNAAFIASMKAGESKGFWERYDFLEPVIKNSFDFPYIVRKVTGKYWNNMNENERNILLESYANWTVAQYAYNFDQYKGQKFKVVSESEFRPQIMNVRSDLIKTNNETTKFSYFLIKHADSWRIIDVKVGGVSQLAVNRSQFKQILKNKGFDGLNASLQEKIKILSARREN